MEVQRIFQKLITRSGQFLLTPSKVELNIERFRDILEDTCAVYSKFSPYKKHITVNATGERVANLSPSLVYAQTGQNYLGTPDWVSDASPVRQFAINPFFLFKNLDPMNNPELIDKTQAPYEYRKPMLYLPFSAEWDVLCVWKHKIVEEEINGEFVYSVPTIDANDTIFFDHLQGLFLQGIGKSRRAFTLNDLPISMDASDIASEGKEMERQALEDLENHQDFYLGW